MLFRSVDITWEIDAYRFELPMMAAAMDGVVSPATAAEISRLGGLPVLNLEGLWTRYADPEPLLAEIASLPDEIRGYGHVKAKAIAEAKQKRPALLERFAKGPPMPASSAAE